MSKKVLILGVNGFIGNSLSEAILQQKDWEIFGMDMSCDKLENCLGKDKFHYIEGDITINKEWIAYHMKKCDVVLPLVAIATPATYVNNPLSVFELDFEANLELIRQAIKYKTRVVFPSTSEVYGMCDEKEFNEETSKLIQGPINKPRWIYSACKQLLDRVIFAYGEKGELDFTLFRPFNWIGPKLDNILAPKEGSSRVLTQFIGNIMRGQDITLVNGGSQRRCFTDIDDGIDCLLKIIENKKNCASGHIFNIGNPHNDFSIEQLAKEIIKSVKQYPKYKDNAAKTKLIKTPGEKYYGKGYQDISARIPSIKNAKKYLGWEPKTDMQTSLGKTLDYHLKHEDEKLV